MQLLQQQTLQSLGGLALRGIDTGFRKQARRIDTSLGQQITKAGIFYFESIFLMNFSVDCRERG